MSGPLGRVGGPLLLLAGTCGCAAPAPEIRVTHVDSEVGNAVEVTWASEVPVAGAVRAQAGNETPAVVATEHTHRLWGLPPDRVVTLTVLEDGLPVGETSVRTDAPPPMPAFSVEAGETDGFLAVPWSRVGVADAGVVVLDGEGTPLAWTAGHPLVTCVEWQDDTLWFNTMGAPAAIHRAPLDGGAIAATELPDAHHEFVRLPDALAFLRTTARAVDGETVLGDQIVLRTDAGDETVVWDAFDTLPVTRHEAWETRTDGGDWTHANGLYRDGDTWLVSLLWLEQVLRIDDDGQIVETFDGRLLGFGPQHAPESDDGGLLLFDNGPGGGTSRILRLDAAGSTTLAWSPDPAISSTVLGDVDRLSDGGLLTAWATEGLVLRLSAEGEPLWQLRAEAPYMVGQPVWMPSLYAAAR